MWTITDISRYIASSTSLQIGLAILLIFISHAILVEMGFWRKKLDVKGKHCYVTGGSAGLGRALALELVKRGASVTIVARGQGRLDEVKVELEAIASPTQIIQAISADLTSPDSSTAALTESTKSHNGRCPEHIYLCAGYAQPQFFIDASAKDLKDNLDGTYWVSAYTAHAATKMMVSQRIHGKIVFVSSFVGYVSFAGYSPYAPGKFALRGLADSLRSELLLHDISVHIFMPCGIKSPGYENEQKLKPRITKKIEEDDVILPPEQVARSLVSGLEKGYYQITNLLVCDIVRVQSKGSAPFNNVFIDTFYLFLSLIGLQIWRRITDYQVRKEAPKVRKELEDRGYYAEPSK